MTRDFIGRWIKIVTREALEIYWAKYMENGSGI